MKAIFLCAWVVLTSCGGDDHTAEPAKAVLAETRTIAMTVDPCETPGAQVTAEVVEPGGAPATIHFVCVDGKLVTLPAEGQLANPELASARSPRAGADADQESLR
ncbi:hypothetical protein WG902_04445 [Ramlibacter sp. PS3R-8]|uniref:hypothetical protein n=1 Tax=Ramlibacter sp. PS3R-8 TaxID=3133437 RepID=UPI00309A8F36